MFERRACNIDSDFWLDISVACSINVANVSTSTSTVSDAAFQTSFNHWNEGDLFLFLTLTLTYFFPSRFYYLWAWWKKNYFLFPCLVLFISAYWRSLWVFNTLFADLSYELPPALPFLPCLNAKVNYRRNNIYIILICIYRPCDIIYLLYWIYIIR